MKTASLARASIGALALTVLAGCGGTATFTIEETFTIDGVGNIDETLNINLADLAGDAWDHRDKIKDAKITAATAIVTEEYGNNTADTVSGAVTLSGAGGAVTFAEGTNVAIADNAVYAVENGNLGPLADTIKSSLKGNGQMELTTLGTVAPGGAATHIDVTVLIDVEVEWSVF